MTEQDRGRPTQSETDTAMQRSKHSSARRPGHTSSIYKPSLPSLLSGNSVPSPITITPLALPGFAPWAAGKPQAQHRGSTACSAPGKTKASAVCFTPNSGPLPQVGLSVGPTRSVLLSPRLPGLPSPLHSPTAATAENVSPFPPGKEFREDTAETAHTLALLQRPDPLSRLSAPTSRPLRPPQTPPVSARLPPRWVAHSGKNHLPAQLPKRRDFPHLNKPCPGPAPPRSGTTQAGDRTSPATSSRVLHEPPSQACPCGQREGLWSRLPAASPLPKPPGERWPSLYLNCRQRQPRAQVLPPSSVTLSLASHT